MPFFIFVVRAWLLAQPCSQGGCTTPPGILGVICLQNAADAATLNQPQPPSKTAPAMRIGAKDVSVATTTAGIREEIEKRLHPDSIYIKAEAWRLPNFYRQVLDRALFEMFPQAHGDRGVIFESLRAITSENPQRYKFIHENYTGADIKWIRDERKAWLKLAVASLKAEEEAKGGPAQIEVEVPKISSDHQHGWATSSDRHCVDGDEAGD